MPVEERFVDHDGVRIRYLDNGQSPRPELLPVVFVPGLTDCAEDYLQMFELFGDRRLLVIEMRGRGGSGSPERGYSAADHAGDLESVVAAEGLRRFHLMTFSRGTTGALDVARADGARVATLAVGDYRLAEVALPPAFVEQMWRSRWRGRQVSERVNRHVLDGIQAESRDRPLWDDVAALDIPVLVARGGEGGIVSDEVAETFRLRIPGVEITVVPGSGHDLFRPDRLAYPRAALEFIARRCPGT
ncbi:MAG TPA: alpha/beta hydrolase [Acidimicrobiales bacterium]|nr:alpha/beta hydrolase [Acidimicrobiales bacterium]